MLLSQFYLSLTQSQFDTVTAYTCWFITARVFASVVVGHFALLSVLKPYAHGIFGADLINQLNSMVDDGKVAKLNFL